MTVTSFTNCDRVRLWHNDGDAVPGVLLRVRHTGYLLPVHIRDHVLHELPGVRRKEAGGEEGRLPLSSEIELEAERVQPKEHSADHLRELHRPLDDQEHHASDSADDHRRSSMRQHLGGVSIGSELRSSLYINEDSYPIQFNEKLKEYFPKYGKRAAIYMTGVDYYEDRESSPS